MKLDLVYSSSVNVATYCVLLTVAIINLGSTAILYISVIGFLHLLILRRLEINRNRMTMEQEEELRWIADRIAQVVGYNQYRSRYQLNKILKRSISGELAFAELGLDLEEKDISANPPQIIRSETAYTKLEEKATMLIGTNVFIPVLFGIIHLFRSTKTFSLFLELIIALLLTSIVISYQPQIIDLNGWKKNLQRLEGIRNRLNVTGYQELVTFPELFRDPYIIETGRLPTPYSDLASTRTTAAILYVAMTSSSSNRNKILDILIHEFRPLSKHEELVAEKWKAYRSRISIISVASVAISGLIASISSILIPIIQLPGGQLETTTNLGLFLYFLVISVNLLTSSFWFTPKELGRHAILWTAIFGLTVLMTRFILIS